MARFAKLDDNNVVLAVHVIHNNELLDDSGNENEQKGIDFLTSLYGHTHWKQCSYNTYGGVHVNGGMPFRKNYPDVFFTYDVTRDAFIPPKPFDSWILNEDTCVWDPPTPRPHHDDPEIAKLYKYVWDEDKWNSEQNGWIEYNWNNALLKWELG